MIKYHGRKLADIRNYAVDYRIYLLEVYVYLREGRKEKFQKQSIQESLWRSSLVVRSEMSEEHTEGSSTTGRNTGCAHCKSKVLHEVMEVGLGQANCPLKEAPRNQARQMVSELLSHFKKHPSCDKAEYVKKKILAVKDK